IRSRGRHHRGDRGARRARPRDLVPARRPRLRSLPSPHAAARAGRRTRRDRRRAAARAGRRVADPRDVGGPVPDERRADRRAARAPVVAISPIIGGVPVKGPADRLLRGLGHEVSARGVAALYGELLDGYVLDARDAAQVRDVEARGVRARAVETLMRTPEIAAEPARSAIA